MYNDTAKRTTVHAALSKQRKKHVGLLGSKNMWKTSLEPYLETELRIPPKAFAQTLEHKLLTQNERDSVFIEGESKGAHIRLVCREKMSKILWFGTDKSYNPELLLTVNDVPSGCIVTSRFLQAKMSKTRKLTVWIFFFFFAAKVLQGANTGEYDVNQITGAGYLTLASLFGIESVTRSSRRKEEKLRAFVTQCLLEANSPPEDPAPPNKA